MAAFAIMAPVAPLLGTELGYERQRLDGLRAAGYLHDIGKIAIPAEILARPGKLSAMEFAMIQEHSRAGYEVLKDVEFPWPVAQAADACLRLFRDKGWQMPD